MNQGVEFIVLSPVIQGVNQTLIILGANQTPIILGATFAEAPIIQYKGQIWK